MADGSQLVALEAALNGNGGGYNKVSEPTPNSLAANGRSSGGWIKSGDQLPEEGIGVIMHNPFWNEPAVRLGFVDSGKWFFDDFECLPCNPGPTHWRHWPEPPHEKEEVRIQN
jgi:hypothetical protein